MGATRALKVVETPGGASKLPPAFLKMAWAMMPEGGEKTPDPATTAAPYLRLTVLLNPAEDTGRQLLKAGHGDGGIEGLEQGVHDALKNVELYLVRDLVLPLMGVVLVCLHNLLIVPESRQARAKVLKQFYWPRKNRVTTLCTPPRRGRGFPKGFCNIFNTS